MLLTLVIFYLLVTIAIGLWAAKRVKNTADFAIAGRHLPLVMIVTTTFATWFGSETVLGIPAKFVQGGLNGVVEDPFGAGTCLILVGLFFAAKLYKMTLLTISDYYRERFGRAIEVVCSLIIILSYLGWVSAQVTALGLVFNVLSGGAISPPVGMVIGTVSILAYTLFGGMWSVAVTDFIQMIIIVIGMLYIGAEVSQQAGGVVAVVSHAAAAGKFEFLPSLDLVQIVGFAAALFTMMLGSIPQQDVFQRVTSSRTEKIAGTASVLGGVLYFCFAFVPMFLAYSATLIDPQMVAKYINADSQLILPSLVLNHAPMFAQVMFFGALLSAIKSCASATLLAPSVTFAENILRPYFRHLDDRRFLRVMQCVVLAFTVLVTLFALNSHLSIFHMVENAYKVTLVSSFVPLAFGMFWKPATRQGGLASILLGLVSWIVCEISFADAVVPPQMVGLMFSIAGMVVGSMLPQWMANRPQVKEVHIA